MSFLSSTSIDAKQIFYMAMYLLSCAITVLIFSFLYLPVSFSLILYLLLFFLKERLLVSLSINFTGFIVLLFLHMVSGDISNKQYSSPHQKLILDPNFNYLNYPVNKSLLNITVSKGDLGFVDNLPSEYLSDRNIDFITGKLGFRNKKDFVLGDILAVGDSYVVGIGGVDQNDTISSKLEKYSGKGVYNLGFPGDPFNYYHRLLKYDELIKKSGGIILFAFEGNDLNCHNKKDSKNLEDNNFTSVIKSILGYRLTIFENMLAYKIGFGIYHRAFSIITGKGIQTYRSVVNGNKVAFLKDYVDILYVDEICPKRLQEFTAIYDKYSNKIKLVVYIPTKGHIYFESLGNMKPSNIKAMAMEALATRYGVGFMDLTTAFLAKKTPAMLYFRDDSHWNSLGIDVAAKTISSRL